MSKDPRIYMTHILERIGRISSYTAGGKEAFFDDPLVQDAVVRNLEVIGEAAKRIPDDYRHVVVQREMEFGVTRASERPPCSDARVLEGIGECSERAGRERCLLLRSAELPSVAHPAGYPWRVALLRCPLPFHRRMWFVVEHRFTVKPPESPPA